MASDTPTYWSIDADTYGAWVSLLGIAAAGKLMAACAAYFFDGTEPDACKLTKQARALFEGERGRMERRRASALNGRRGGRRAATADDHDRAASVEKSENREKSERKPRRSSGKTAEKSAKNQTIAHGSTSGINKSRLAPVLNLSPNLNPQTPAPGGGGAGSGARGPGSVTPAEFAALLEAGLGYATATAYGMTG